MNYRQTQTAVEQLRQVCYGLADVITTMDLSIELYNDLSRAERIQYELYWREAHLKAIQELQQSLDGLTCNQASYRLHRVHQ
ncbi:MAG: hypothetical protein NT075_19265 [Chloroflexi bacterium]|nr:hypothetical protein [Chloroflexota bacterium]